MDTRLIIIPLIVVMNLSCQNKQKDSVQNVSDTSNILNEPDTSIGSMPITNEIAGANYRTRAKGYFTISDRDTSKFMLIITESNENKVGMTIRFQKNMTYAQQLKELNKLLPEASKDFEFDSIRSIFLGRLISTGDLAIEISKELNQEEKLKNKLNDYHKVASFLLKSKLTSDFNRLLYSFSVYVDTIYPEKVFLTQREELYMYSKIETEPVKIPVRILDCLTWMALKKITVHNKK